MHWLHPSCDINSLFACPPAKTRFNVAWVGRAYVTGESSTIYYVRVMQTDKDDVEIALIVLRSF